MDQIIRGAGGKSGGGAGRVAQEAPDSLRSKQFATVVDALCEGEIVGLVNGLKSIYLDGTPLQNADGSFNFKDVSLQESVGTQSLGTKSWGVPRYFDSGGVSTPRAVDVEIKADTPVVRTVDNPNADYVDVVLGIPQLSAQDKTTGDVSGTSVIIAIDRQIAGGGWEQLPIGGGWYPAGAFISPDYWSFSGVSGMGVTANLSVSVAEYADDSGGIVPGYTTVHNEVQWRVAGGAWASLAPVYAVRQGRYRHEILGLDLNQSYELRIVTVVPGLPTEPSDLHGTGMYDTISGKTMSRYQRSYRVALPGDGRACDIRMRRISPAAADSSVQNRTFWDSMNEVVDVKLTYPNTACVMVTVNAEQFQSIPSRGYDIKGLIIQVPTNYDPATRAYTGSWDGTFKRAWSDNPAWCFYDLVTHRRYGLGDFIDPTQVDKWQLYAIAKYCDELVPNGFGGWEPRFTCNLYLQTREEAFKVVSSMASIFRGMAFWANSQLMAVQDRPGDVEAIFTPANVVDGMFNYQGSDVRARRTVCLVSWNDPEDEYKQKVEYVQDDAAVLKWGVIQTEILAVGCTSRGQAHRVGEWLLYTEQNETETVTFRAGLDAARVGPGSIIQTTDPVRAGRRQGGRLKSVPSATQLELDAPVTLEANQGTSISFVLPTGKIAAYGLSAAGNVYGTPTSTLTLSVPMLELPAAGAMWVLAASNLRAETWRVLAVSEAEGGSQVDITAVEHHPGKFVAVERDIPLTPLPTSSIKALPDTPSNLVAVENHYPSGFGTPAFRLNLSWSGQSPRYTVDWRQAAGNWTQQTVYSPTITLDNVAAGNYELRIKAVNSLGRASAALEQTIEVLATLPAPPAPALATLAVENQDRMVLSWAGADSPYSVQYEVRATNAGWGAGTPVFRGAATSCTVAPAAAGAPTVYYVKTIDAQGQYSAAAAQASLTVTAPAAPALSSAFVDTAWRLSWADVAAQFLVDGYEIRRGASWATGTLVGRIKGTSLDIAVDWTGSQTFWVAGYDIRGNMGAAASRVATVTAPAAPVLGGAFAGTNYLLSWTAPATSLPIAAYEVRQGSSFAAGALVGRATALQLAINVDWLGSRTFWVAAVDANGNVGTAASRVTTVTAPGTPTALAVSYDPSQAVLSWTGNPGTLPIASYEVRRGASWATGAVVGKADTNRLAMEVSWTTSATFWVQATDANGNTSGQASLVTNVSAPGAVAVAHQFKDGNVILTWAAPTAGSLAVRGYEIREGASWVTASVVGSTSDTSYSLPVNWTSSKTFWVAAFDASGAYGAAGSRVVTYTAYGAVANLAAALSQAAMNLTWASPVGGSLPIAHYDIRFGGLWDSGEVIAKSNTTAIALPVNWTGARTFWVTPVDSNGQFGTSASVAVTVSAPSAMSVNAAVVVAKAELSWSVPSSSLPIREYEIRHGASFAAGTLVATTLATNYRVPIDWSGSRTFWVAARDINGNVGTAGSAAVAINAPAAPTVTSAFLLDQFSLTWTVPAAVLPIAEYEVRHGASWAAGTSIGRVKGTTMSLKAQWSGQRTWWVAAIDVNGNVGTAVSTQVTITAPAAPTLTRQVVDNNVLLYWTQAVGTLPVATYEIRRGADWASAVSVGQKSGGFTTIFETVAGSYTYQVAAIDSAGNLGTPGSVTVQVVQPPDYLLKADNNLAFGGYKANMVQDGQGGGWVMPVAAPAYRGDFDAGVDGWSAQNATLTAANGVLTLTATTTDPCMRRSFSGASSFYGAGAKKVTMRVRRTSGTGAWTGKLYYWNALHPESEAYYDLAPAPAVLTDWSVVEWDMTALSVGGADWRDNLVQGVRFDLTDALDTWEIDWIQIGGETFEQHFASRGWAGPQAQIDAGYSIFIQPGMLTGFYEEDIDYGTVLAGTKITVSPTGTVVAGSPTVQVDISVKAASGDPWTTYTNTSSVFVNNFQFVRVRVTVSGTDQALYRLTNINVRLDAKLRNDSGMGQAGAADSVSGTNATVNGVAGTGNNPLNSFGKRVPDGAGTMVRFNYGDVVDVSSLEVSVAAGSTARYALYDFLDETNPAGFKVVLYDAAGTRVGGNFSWSAKFY